MSFKIVILGDTGVGKTSLVSQFMHPGAFDARSAPTIGASFHCKYVNATDPITMDLKRIRLELWDTAGQERYRALAKMYHRSAAIVIFCYDMTRPESLNSIIKFWADDWNHTTLVPGATVALIACKADSPRIKTASEFLDDEGRDPGARLSAKLNRPVLHMVSSAKTGFGITTLFKRCVDNALSTGVPLTTSNQYVKLNLKEEKSKKRFCCR